MVVIRRMADVAVVHIEEDASQLAREVVFLGDLFRRRGTPEKIAKENHFSGKLRGIFFNMDYRNISHPCLSEEAPQPKRKIPGKSRRESVR
mgnify:CR=1 FL=1